MRIKAQKNTQKTWPRLVAQQNEPASKNETGFLQINSKGQKIKIGDTLGREFKLMQCLFSAQNFLSAKYAPVTQTYERLYSAIKIKENSGAAQTSGATGTESDIAFVVNGTVSSLKNGPAGRYLTFMNVGSMLRMDIADAAL